MKNFVKEGQKLPLYGVGPMIVFGMGIVTAIGIILFAGIAWLGYSAYDLVGKLGMAKAVIPT